MHYTHVSVGGANPVGNHEVVGVEEAVVGVQAGLGSVDQGEVLVQDELYGSFQLDDRTQVASGLLPESVVGERVMLGQLDLGVLEGLEAPGIRQGGQAVIDGDREPEGKL